MLGGEMSVPRTRGWMDSRRRGKGTRQEECFCSTMARVRELRNIPDREPGRDN